MNTISKSIFHFLAFISLTATCVSCVSDGGYTKMAPLPTPDPLATPAPPPPPPPPPTYWGCKISNTEGRIFRGLGNTAYLAEMDARLPCQRQYRHCILLGCESGVLKNWK